MTLPNLVRTTLDSRHKPRNSRSAPRKRRRTLPLRLEQLEERLAPATVFWNVDQDGFWDVAGNWRDDLGVSRVPGANDDVVLDRPAGVFTVTNRLGATIRSLRSNENLTLTGGTLSLATASTIGGAFTFSGGFLTLNGSLNLSGASTWIANSIRGPGGLTNTGTLTLSGTAAKTLGSALTNTGTFVHTGSGALVFNGGTLENRAGGLLDLQSDASWSSFGSGAAGNAGTLRKSGGTGTSALNIPFHNQGGSLDIRTGTLALQSGNHTGGTFTVATGAVLDLGSPTLTGSYTGSGTGIVRLNRFLAVSTGGATFNFPAGLFHWTGSFITATAGVLTNLGTITLSETTSKVLTGTLNNAGTLLHRDTGALILSNGTLNNLAGGVYDLQGDAGFIPNSTTTSAVTNAGTLRKSAGTGTSTLAVNSPGFHNQGGTLDVRSGTLVLPSVGTSTGGPFSVAAGAVLDLGSLTYTGTYAGSRAGTVRVSRSLTVGAGGATFNFPAGEFQWTGGPITATAGALTTTGALRLTGTGSKVLTGTLTHSGGFLLDAGALIVNGALTSSGTSQLSGGTLSGTGSLTLNGTRVLGS